jgi:hypothetical protein
VTGEGLPPLLEAMWRAIVAAREGAPEDAEAPSPEPDVEGPDLLSSATRARR